MGQSEVLTICGAYFLSQGNNTLGGILLAFGIIGALVRQTLDVNFTSKYIDHGTNEFDE